MACIERLPLALLGREVKNRLGLQEHLDAHAVVQGTRTTVGLDDGNILRQVLLREDVRWRLGVGRVQVELG